MWCTEFTILYNGRLGEVAEWSNAAVLKTVDGLNRPGVRIPPSPPVLMPKAHQIRDPGVFLVICPAHGISHTSSFESTVQVHIPLGQNAIPEA